MSRKRPREFDIEEEDSSFTFIDLPENSMVSLMKLISLVLKHHKIMMIHLTTQIFQV